MKANSRDPIILLLFFILMASCTNNSSSAPTAPVLLFSEEFSLALDITTGTAGDSIAHQGFWRFNDTWQQVDCGYKDFAGQSWNINPLESGFASYSPFDINAGFLTISARRVPAALVTPIVT